MKGKKVKESKTEMCIEAIPLDANSAGNVHGGTIMKLIDSTAAVVAKRHCREQVSSIVTAAIDNVQFLSPANIGNLIVIKASVNYTGRTSLEVGVRVETEDLRTGKINYVNSAYLTFVALDENGCPTPVPSVIPMSKEEKRRFQEGKERSEIRKANRKKKLKK